MKKFTSAQLTSAQHIMNKVAICSVLTALAIMVPALIAGLNGWQNSNINYWIINPIVASGIAGVAVCALCLIGMFVCAVLPYEPTIKYYVEAGPWAASGYRGDDRTFYDEDEAKKYASEIRAKGSDFYAEIIPIHED